MLLKRKRSEENAFEKLRHIGKEPELKRPKLVDLVRLEWCKFEFLHVGKDVNPYLLESDPIKEFCRTNVCREDFNGEHFRSVLRVNFEKKNRDLWFNIFCRSYTAEELVDRKKDFEMNRKFFMIEHPNFAVLNTKKIIANQGEHLPNIYLDLESYLMENDLEASWLQILEIQNVLPLNGFRNSFQHVLFSIMNSYKDLLYCGRTLENEKAIVEAYTLHVTSHLLKTKRYQWYNKAKRTIRSQYQVKDKTFGKPFILILVPFRHTAFQFVTLLSSLLPKLKNIRKEEAFDLTFGNDAPSIFHTKFYKETFRGNLDDNFSLGISLHNGQLELMSSKLQSDIIIATPFGLKHDFRDTEQLRSLLTSIELCIVDRADVLEMQNWDFLIHTFENLNQPLQSPHIDNVNLLKDSTLHNETQQFRQTIIFSKHPTNEINALLTYCNNSLGQMKCIPSSDGIIYEEPISIPLHFEAIYSEDLEDVDEQKFEYFKSSFLPRFGNIVDPMIIICTFYEHLRLKKYFEDENETFVAIDDHAEKPEKLLTKAINDQVNYILFTERQWYFREIKSKNFKIKNYLFYSLPINPELFLKFALRADAVSKNLKDVGVYSFFSKFDRFQLERVLGRKKSRTLLKQRKKKYEIKVKHSE